MNLDWRPYRRLNEPEQPAVPFGASLQVTLPDRHGSQRIFLHFVHSLT